MRSRWRSNWRSTDSGAEKREKRSKTEPANELVKTRPPKPVAIAQRPKHRHSELPGSMLEEKPLVLAVAELPAVSRAATPSDTPSCRKPSMSSTANIVAIGRVSADETPASKGMGQEG